MLLLGIDLGTSSIKVSVVDAATGIAIATAQHPEMEREIKSLQPGWAEQSPEQWWQDVITAIQKVHASKKYDPAEIAAIGIAYQMHGLVALDKHDQTVRDSIIWCDSRAVNIGNHAFQSIGQEKCLTRLLNSPGNFTASKLAWVKENEPEKYAAIQRVMLPGDFIAMKMTGEKSTTVSALSEGIFWDFESDVLSKDVLDHFGIDPILIPLIKDVFSEHGRLTEAVAKQLSLKKGIPVSYKAGDQPNNALSLNVLEPGEVAANAGTSGVIYGVSNQLSPDPFSRVNSFAHVNYTNTERRLGVLLNINGAGSLNRWIRDIIGPTLSYTAINEAASMVAPGSDGLTILPFGNGAERMLHNQIIHAQIHGIDFNRHQKTHIFRAAQEGIAFAFRYGLDILLENGIDPSIIRAGKANMFQSQIFTETFVNVTGIPVEFYNTDGSVGAAIGAGIGAGIYASAEQAFQNAMPTHTVQPQQIALYDELYQNWKAILFKQINE